MNDAPIIYNFKISGNEDEIIQFSIINFTSNFIDVDNDDLSKIKITSLSDHGTLRLEGNKVEINQEILSPDIEKLYF